MVVGAPDVDEVVEATAELLGDVADVRREVRRFAVRAVDDPVLVVAERRRAEPDRPVLFVDVTPLAQPLDRPVDPALVVEPGLARPDVEVDAERLEARLDPRPDPTGRPMAHHPDRVGPGGGRLGPDLVGERRGDLDHVVALVPILRDRLTPPQRHDRRAEVPDLAAGVVEVVLARHALPARLEDPAEQVADEGPARVPDVERAGRIGRHELHVHDAPRRERDAPPGRRVRADPRHDRLEGLVGEAQVDEPRHRGLGPGDQGGVGAPGCGTVRGAHRPAPSRSRTAPADTAGPGAWPGWSRSHRARGRPGARPRSAARPARRAVAAGCRARWPGSTPGRRHRARRLAASASARSRRMGGRSRRPW